MMAIKALLLFGSYARGDNQVSSDIDIIAVVDDARSLPYENKTLSVSFYSEAFLLKICEIGNLFALHLVSEARAIFDPSDVLGQMKSRFRKKPTYSKEIADASMLGWFLLRHVSRIQDWKLFNKRVAWCVRTILIASAYQQGYVFFSSKSLFSYFKNKDAEELINDKASSEYNEASQYKLARFLRDFGLGDPKIYDVDNIINHIEYIFKSDNVIGKNTIASLFGVEHQEYIFDKSFF